MNNVQVKKLSLKKNDIVQVMAGREKGKSGKILKLDAKACRVTVEKLNMVKRHTKATQTTTGGIIERELPIHYSNVQLFCAKCNRGVRHSHKTIESSTGKSGSKKQMKIRVCKRCGESLEVA